MSTASSCKSNYELPSSVLRKMELRANRYNPESSSPKASENGSVIASESRLARSYRSSSVASQGSHSDKSSIRTTRSSSRHKPSGNKRSHEKDDSNNLQLKKPVRTYSKGGSKSSQAKNKNPTNKLPTGAALIPNWPPATVSTPKRRQVALCRSDAYYAWEALNKIWIPSKRKFAVVGQFPGKYILMEDKIYTMLESDYDTKDMDKESRKILKDLIELDKKPSDAVDLDDPKSLDNNRPRRNFYLRVKWGTIVYICGWCFLPFGTGIEEKVIRHMFGQGKEDHKTGCMLRRYFVIDWRNENKTLANLPGHMEREPIFVGHVNRKGFLPDINNEVIEQQQERLRAQQALYNETAISGKTGMAEPAAVAVKRPTKVNPCAQLALYDSPAKTKKKTSGTSTGPKRTTLLQSTLLVKNSSGGNNQAQAAVNDGSGKQAARLVNATLTRLRSFRAGQSLPGEEPSTSSQVHEIIEHSQTSTELYYDEETQSKTMGSPIIQGPLNQDNTTNAKDDDIALRSRKSILAENTRKAKEAMEKAKLQYEEMLAAEMDEIKNLSSQVNAIDAVEVETTDERPGSPII